MATITVRLDDATKKGFVETCNNLGLDMTSALMIYIKKVSRENKIPFEVSVDPFYSESNTAELLAAKERMNNGHYITKTMEELEEMANE